MQCIEVHSKTSRPEESEQAKAFIPLSEFPELFDKHWNGDPSTRSVEIYAKKFVEAGMPRDHLFWIHENGIWLGGDWQYRN